jgi:hypothetical protein
LQNQTSDLETAPPERDEVCEEPEIQMEEVVGSHDEPMEMIDLDDEPIVVCRLRLHTVG